MKNRLYRSNYSNDTGDNQTCGILPQKRGRFRGYTFPAPKWLTVLGCSMILGGSLTGCMKSNIVAPQVQESLRTDPETAVQDDIQLDWAEIGAEIESTFEDPAQYPIADSVNYSYLPDLKHFQLTIVVKADAQLKDISDYTLTVIKGINDLIATQDFSYARSSAESYGGFFDENELQLMVIPGDMYTPKELYILDTTIPAGEYYEFYTEDELGVNMEDISKAMSAAEETAENSEGEDSEDLSDESESAESAAVDEANTPAAQ